MSVARSFGSTEATRASKMGSRCEPRSSAPASSELKAMAPSGAGASMITMRSSLVMASTELSLSNCWRVETTAMRQSASFNKAAICSPVSVG